ncbi:N-acetylmuramoyl-L-alanine amidase [Ornithinibacillus sp. FSL M8-0202]|uniref:N-acetylmuramoyl-L-alanine amidase family protein n=1 Tax=Ornithinibacillus sp. FSL M8-0202 TaxID=2921616 RepID=UPI0030CCBA97
MVKIALDAGHGINTPGKRTPDGEREWSFNSKVVAAATKYLNEYDNVTVIRLDDPTGKIDVSLTARTNKANDQKADILVSYHHNANTGQWGTWTGTETYHYPGSSTGLAIAKKIHPAIVGAMGLRDRGIKSENFHMLRESKMPAILIEGGFMDSTIDIKKLRDDAVLDRTGKELADAIASHFGLKKKAKSKVETAPSSGVHVVEKGDTLWSISQKYNTTVAVLKSLNKISGDLIVPGQKIKLPSGSKKKMLYLPKTASSWRVYPLNKAPVKGNEKGFLNPKKFGGLQYEVLGKPQADVVTIQTKDFGKVNIYVGKETGALIK